MTPEQKQRYKPSSQLPPAWVCQLCGAAVLSYEVHDRFHRNLEEKLAELVAAVDLAMIRIHAIDDDFMAALGLSDAPDDDDSGR